MRGGEVKAAMATCIPLSIVRRTVTALLTYTTIAVSASLAYLYIVGRSNSALLIIGGSIAASLLATAAILYTAVSRSAWSLLALVYPLAGIAVYKTASTVMEVSDECRAVALLSPFLTILVPLSAHLCLQSPRRPYTPGSASTRGAAPGASDAAVSHGGG